MASTRKSARPFIMGVCTVALVVGVIRYVLCTVYISPSLLHTSVLQTPVIFMKMSEDSSGEYDMVRHCDDDDV